MRKQIQAKHISDRGVLEFVARQSVWCTWGEGHSMPTIADACPTGTPEKVQRAKAAALIRRGLLDGCTCGCRGDFEITDKGRAWLADTGKGEA